MMLSAEATEVLLEIAEHLLAKKNWIWFPFDTPKFTYIMSLCAANFAYLPYLSNGGFFVDLTDTGKIMAMKVVAASR